MIRNIIASTFICIASAIPANVCGADIYCNLISGSEPGIYSFPAEGGPLSQVYPYSGLDSKQGGVFTDEAYYSTVYLPGSYITQIYAIRTDHSSDMQEWSAPTRINEKLSISDVPTALTWNCLTRSAYGSFLTSDPESWAFGTFNTADGTCSPVAELPQQLVTIAANDEGAMYGVGADGTLYSVSMTGVLTEIGHTGVTPSPKYASGSAFDNSSGILYWAVTDKSLESALYTIDIASGTASRIYTFPDNTILTALYIPGAPPSGGAPGDVTDLRADPVGFSDLISVSFTLPSKTVAGNEMLGAVKYKVAVDGNVLAEAQGGPGQTVTLTASPGFGLHCVTLSVSNNAGKGAGHSVSAYVGEDAPGPVGDLDIDVSGTSLLLSWTAPTEGMHGGNFDIGRLVYDVIRDTDGKTVAGGISDTFYSETVESAGLTHYRYTVIPTCGSLAGPAVTSADVVTGEGMIPPYEQDFDSAESFDDIYFSAIDANDDGKRWTLYKSYYGDSGYARYDYSATADADDWLFSCPLYLEEGFTYTVGFTLKCGSWGIGERLGVFYGTAPDIGHMTCTAIPYDDYDKGVTHSISGTLVPEITGRYHVGIHLTSPADSYNVELDNLKVDGGIQTSINDIRPENTIIRAKKGAVEIVSEKFGTVEIADITGRIVRSLPVSEDMMSIPLASGIYVVSVNGHTAKVAVR